MKIRIIACVAVIGFLVSGCSKQVKIDSQTPVYLSASNQQIIPAAERILGDMHFVIDKADVNEGYLTTKPLSGQEWFEFWRSDAASGTSLAQSSLYSLQKTVEVTVSKADDGKSSLDCVVKVQKLSIPQKQISGFSELPGMFSKSSTSRQRLDIRNADKSEMKWVDIEDDDELAAKIKEKIIAKI